MSDTCKGSEVVVVGAGVIGCGVGRALARQRLAVTVVDRGEPGAEATRAAGGMLSPLGEAEGEGPFLRLGLESLRLWPDFAAALEEETGRDLHYRMSGKLQVALDPEGEERLRRRVDWQRAAGHPVTWLSPREALEREPELHPDLRGAVHYEAAHQVDNRVLGPALYHAARRAGARFCLGTRVRGVRIEGGRSAGVVLDDGRLLEADRVVIAAGAWSGSVEGLPRPLPVRPVRGQMVQVGAVPGFLSRIVETGDAYLIPRPDGRVIVGSTMEDVGFRKGTTVDAVVGLLEAAVTAVPGLAGASVDESWSGLRPGTPDGLPVLGPDPAVEGVVYATGHFRNGILLAPITARAVSGLLTRGRSPVGLEPFRPDRFDATVLVHEREPD